jgi:hypothetical protein
MSESNKVSKEKETIEEWRCCCCDRTFTTYFGYYIHENSCKEQTPRAKKDSMCSRCNRLGHYSVDCYAKVHIKGYDLD